MTPHQLVPLIALVLNVCLVAIALARNPGSRQNRIFIGFVSAMALWNLGVFMLRRAPDAASAYRWEVLIHAGVIALPAFYYHFVLLVLDTAAPHRRLLHVAYAVSALFLGCNLAVPGTFIPDVQLTAWGWAPTPGPLYRAFLLFFYLMLIGGLVHLARAYQTADSAFRRNRLLLILVGAALTVVGGVFDIARFALARWVPAVEHLYPLGIPANTVCALLFGAAIIRYRMFDVSVAVKRLAVYGAAGMALTAVLVALAWSLEGLFPLDRISVVWVLGPAGFLIAFLVSPLGRHVEAALARLMFSKHRGCHDTLVALSKQLSTLLDSDRLVETLVRGLVRGIPLTHCALLLHDDTSRSLVLRGEETTTGEAANAAPVPADGRLIDWLKRWEGALVKEEAILHGREPVEDLEALRASVIVPLRTEDRITGLLLLGEKLSGEVFDGEELEFLSVLGNQAAIALANAGLYEQADRERRRIEVLYQLSRRLATVGDSEEIFGLVVTETGRLLAADLAAVRLVEGEELVLKASTTAPIAAAFRRRLKIGESLTGLVVATNEPVLVEDVLAERRYDPHHRRAAEASGLHGFLGVPLRVDGQAVGVLYAYTKARRRFRADEISLLSAFADQASVTLERHRMAVERRQAEDALRQSEKLATMGQLLAGVAHELNNPLTVISGWAGLLRTRHQDTALGEPAEQIEIAAQRCSRIVQNFLGLARKRPPERQGVALNRIVTDAVELLGYPLGLDNVEVNLDLAADLPDLWADQHQLQQVIVNLITNAHYAMRQTTPRRLTVTTRGDAARTQVVLQVTDSGPGIPREIQARIFEPFFTTKPVGEGTGLGLSLCHGIVTGHGGTIALDSQPGRGAVFTITLPVQSTRAPVDDGAAKPAPAVPPLRILVVDDEASVTGFLQQFLELDGHQVDASADPRLALDRLAGERYDLVLCDVRMPHVDGPTLYRKLQGRRAPAAPPFVFMTGDILGADTLAFLEQTKAPCLKKPFVLDEVRVAIAAAFQRSERSDRGALSEDRR